MSVFTFARIQRRGRKPDVFWPFVVIGEDAVEVLARPFVVAIAAKALLI